MEGSEIRRIAIVGCIALVVVRLAIGWQMLYEGLWKLHTQSTADPWTAEPYLKNSQGPLRDYFRSLTGDPNDFQQLDYETVAARWTGWKERFKKHYQLDETQQRQLDEMLDGPKEFRRVLEAIPEGVVFDGSLGEVIRFDPEAKRLIVNGETHMTPREKQRVLDMVDFNEATDKVADIQDPVKKKFVEEVLKIYEMQSRLSYKEQLLATLKGDPEWAGLVDPRQKGTVDEKRLGKIALYKDRLARYEQKLDQAKTNFNLDHLEYDWREIMELRSELLGPIKQMESDFKWRAEKLLTTDQIARGPVPEPMTAQRSIDLQTMWALTIIGGLLIAGLATRIAALAGAFLILQFYLAFPPFPGYPQPPGPEHAIVINKNLIEVLMLVAFVFLPTGRWFGVDAIFAGFFMSKDPDDRM